MGWKTCNKCEIGKTVHYNTTARSVKCPHDLKATYKKRLYALTGKAILTEKQSEVRENG